MAKETKDIQTCWENLANAIIEQAVNDYRKALAGRNPNHPNTPSVRALERFFRSDWFKVLTSVDGTYIMNKVRDEIGIQRLGS